MSATLVLYLLVIKLIINNQVQIKKTHYSNKICSKICLKFNTPIFELNLKESELFGIKFQSNYLSLNFSIKRSDWKLNELKDEFAKINKNYLEKDDVSLIDSTNSWT